jgi:hypothetical protein
MPLLLSLPIEVRLKIWALCFPPQRQIETEWGFCFDQCITSRNNESSYIGHFGSSVDFSVHLFRPILQVNHQIRNEALPLAKAGSQIRFSHHACLSDYLGALAREERKDVRAVRVKYIDQAIRWRDDVIGSLPQPTQPVYWPITRILQEWYFEQPVLGDVETVVDGDMRVLTFDVKMEERKGKSTVLKE